MNDILNFINKFRKKNGISECLNWDHIVSGFCREHCWAMARAGHIYHTESFYLGDWKEAVASCNFLGDWNFTLQFMIFNLLGESEEHRKILLESTILAGDAIIFNHNIYLTIRGK